MFNVFKKKKTVDECLKKNDLAGALQLLEEQLEEAQADPESGAQRLPALLGQMADLYIRDQQESRAVECYMSLGGHFEERGFFNKAVATYKKVLRLQPDNTEVMEKVADFNRSVPKFMVNTQLADAMREKSKELQEERENQPPTRR